MPEYDKQRQSQAPTGGAGAQMGAQQLDVGAKDAAQGQSAELQGGEAEPKTPAEGQAEEARQAAEAEKKRQAAAQAEWQRFLGEKLGEKLYEKLRDVVGFEAMQGHAQKAVDSLAKAIADGPFKPTEAGAAGGLMDEKAEADALNKLAKALSPEIEALAEKWVESETGQKVLRAVSEWTEEHPRTVAAIIGTVLIGGAVAAYLVNADIPELEKTFKIADGLKAEAGVELGKLQEIALKAVKVGVTYETDGLKASLKAVYDKEDGISATAHVEGGGRLGSSEVKGSADLTVSEGGEMIVKASGDLKTQLGSTPATASASASHDTAKDRTRVEAKITVGETGEQRYVSGFYEPTSDSFKLTLGQTALDGRFTRETSFGQDDEGVLSSEDSFSYKATDALSLSYGEGQKGDDPTRRAGVKFDTKRLEAELDYEMVGARESLGWKGRYDLDDGYSFGTSGKYSLTDSRIEELGASVGWKDPKEFKGWMLSYKGKYLGSDPGFEHQFDAAVEYSMGRLAGRLQGGVDLQGSQIQKGNVDALAGYRLGDKSDWQVLGGVEYTGERGGMGGIQNDFSARVGVQYKNVAVTVGHEMGSGDNFIRLEIPLLRW